MLAGEILGFLLALGFNGPRDAAEIYMSMAMGRKYLLFKKYMNEKNSLHKPVKTLPAVN